MVQDVVRQGISPATGSEVGSQSVVDYNLRADGSLNIPNGATNTLNGAKDRDGYIRLTLNAEGDLVLNSYADGKWTEYLAVLDGLKTVGGITLDGNEVTVVAPVKWRINSVNYQKLTNTVLTVNSATDGFKRIDYIYADTNGNVLLIEGTEVEDGNPYIPPTLPVNTVMVAPVYISGDTIVQPIPDLSNYLTKETADGLYIQVNPNVVQAANMWISGKGSFGNISVGLPPDESLGALYVRGKTYLDGSNTGGVFFYGVGGADNGINIGSAAEEVELNEGHKFLILDPLTGLMKSAPTLPFLPIYYNVKDYGAIGDGSTPNDIFLNNAKAASGTNKYLYFPQNLTNDAVYYFTSTPDLSGYILKADRGVKLSFPTTNYTTFNEWGIDGDISVISRDRDNTGLITKNNELESILLPLSGLDRDEQPVNLTAINGNYFVSKKYHIGADLSSIGAVNSTTTSSVTLASGSITSSDSTDANTFGVIVQPAMLGLQYSASIKSSNVADGLGGVFVEASGEWVFFGVGTTDYKLISKKTGVAATTVNISNNISGAYGLSSISTPEVSVRIVSDSMLEFYVNGYKVYTYNISGYVISVGYGANRTLNQSTSQIISNMITSYVRSNPSGGVLNIAYFGDSNLFGEGSSFNAVTLVKKSLIGRSGISDVVSTNYAHSGDNAADQYTIMSGVNLSSFKYTVVMVGTNDIGAQTALSAFKTTIGNIITKIKSDGSTPIICIPAMYIDSASTGGGFNTTNYGLGGDYRSAIKQICALENVIVSDVNAFLGEISGTNKQLRDNVHFNSFYHSSVARAIATSILYDQQKRTPSLLLENGKGLLSGDRYGNYTVLQALSSNKDEVKAQIIMDGVNEEAYIESNIFRYRQGINGVGGQIVISTDVDGKIGTKTDAPTEDFDINGVLRVRGGIPSNILTQEGSYLSWNDAGLSGTTSVINNRGGGTDGGIVFQQVIGGVRQKLVFFRANGEVEVSSLSGTGTRPVAAQADGTLGIDTGGARLAGGNVFTGGHQDIRNDGDVRVYNTASGASNYNSTLNSGGVVLTSTDQGTVTTYGQNFLNRLHSSGFYSRLIFATPASANREYTLPDQTGTVALTSDVVGATVNSSSSSLALTDRGYYNYIGTGNATWILPPVSGNTGKFYRVYNKTGGNGGDNTGILTLDANASEEFFRSGTWSTTLTLAFGESVTLQCDGTEWNVYG